MQFPALKSLFTKKNILTAASWIGAQLLVLIFVTVFLIGAIVTTQGGRNWLVNNGVSWLRDSDLLAAQGIAIELEGFDAPQTDQLHFDHLTVYKNEQLWVSAKDFNLDFEIKPLWRGDININNLTAAQLIYHQQPLSENPDEQVEAQKTTKGLTELTLPAFKLVNLDIAHLELIGVLPQSLHNPRLEQNSVVYHLRGHGFHNTGAFGQSKLELSLILEPSTKSMPAMTITANGKGLFDNQLSVAVEESPMGWLGYWLQLPDDRALSAQLEANVATNQQQLSLSITDFTLPVAHESVGLNGDIHYKQFLAGATQDQNTWQLRTDNLHLKVANSVHPVSLDIEYPNIQAYAKIRQLPLQVFSAWLPELNRGTINGDLAISETVTAPKIKADINSDIVYADQPLNLSANIMATTSNVVVEKFNAKYMKAQANAKGTLSLEEGTNDFSLSITGFTSETLAPFLSSLPPQLTFEFTSITGQLKGTLENPSGHFNASGSGTYDKLAFTTLADVKAEGDMVNISSLQLNLPDGHAHAIGTLNYKTLAGDFNAQVKDVPITLANAAGISLPPELNGVINASVTSTGNVKAPLADAEIAIQGLIAKQPYSLDVSAATDDKSYTLESLDMIVAQKNIINAKGQYVDDKIQSNLRITQLSTELLNKLGIQAPEGIVNSNLSITGSLLEPIIDGQFSYALQQMGYDKNGDQVPLDMVLSTDAKTQNNTLQLNSRLFREDLAPGHLNIALPLHDYINTYINDAPESLATTPLNADVDMNLDLQAIAFLIDPDVNQITGVIEADLSARGVLADPTLNGYLKLKDASYFNSIMGTQVEKLQCSFLAKSQTFSLDECQGTDGNDGRYSVQGSISLPKTDSNGVIDVILATKKAEVVKRVDINSHATGEISIKGDFEKLLAKGELEITPLNAMIDVNMGASAPEIQVTEISSHDSAPTEESQPLFPMPTIALDLVIRASQQAYLRGRGLDTELSGEIFLTGTADDPQYTGEFNTLRGELEVFGKKFNLEQGQASFINNSIAIAVRAVYEKNSNQIFAEVTGQDNDFSIEFSSLPVMPQDEILSYIIFGESAADIEPVKAVQLAMAIQKLQGGSSSFDAVGTARDLLGVDSITFDSQAEDGSGNGGLNIGVGKYLNDRTYLELERTPNPSQPWKGTIEIELTPRIHLQSTTGGTSGIDSAEIIWEKDY